MNLHVAPLTLPCLLFLGSAMNWSSKKHGFVVQVRCLLLHLVLLGGRSFHRYMVLVLPTTVHAVNTWQTHSEHAVCTQCKVFPQELLGEPNNLF